MTLFVDKDKNIKYMFMVNIVQLKSNLKNAYVINMIIINTDLDT